MKVSMLLPAAAQVLVPMQIVFSIYLLLRGHNDPGGGFAAGLMVAAALGLVAISSSIASARQLLRVDPIRLAGMGLLIALASGASGAVAGREFLTAQWLSIELAGVKLDLGTPLFIDVGVYLLVVGVSTAVLFGLMETKEDEWKQ